MVHTCTFLYVLVCTSLYLYIILPVCTCTYQYGLECTGMYQYILVYHGMYWYIPVHTSTYWYIPLIFTMLFWFWGVVVCARHHRRDPAIIISLQLRRRYRRCSLWRLLVCTPPALLPVPPASYWRTAAQEPVQQNRTWWPLVQPSLFQNVWGADFAHSWTDGGCWSAQTVWAGPYSVL